MRLALYAAPEAPRPNAPVAEPSTATEDNGREEIKLVYDLMIAAMQTDSTRVLTFRQPVATLLTSMDIKVHPHDMSHYHTTLCEKLDASQRRDIAQSELLASFLDRPKATKEADGTSLFDHVALAYGSNIRTGRELSNCPTIISGKGAGLKLGQNIFAPKGHPSLQCLVEDASWNRRSSRAPRRQHRSAQGNDRLSRRRNTAGSVRRGQLR